MRLDRKTIITVLGVLCACLIGGVVLFYKYLEVPAHLSWDELEFAQLALSLEGNSYLSYSTFATGHSTLYFYVLLASLKLFGVTTFALRLPSAIFALVSGIMLYLLFKHIFKKDSIAFIGALTLYTSRWFFNFGRFAFEATFLLFLELTSLYFIAKARKNDWFPIVLSAVFAGLSFHSYTPGRIFFLVPLSFLLFSRQIKNAALFLVLFLIIISPLAISLLTTPDSRIDTLSLFTQPITAVEKLEAFAENVKKTGQLFITEGDWNGRHNFPGKPSVNIILFTFSFLGLLKALKNTRNKFNLLFIVYFFTSLIPALLTITEENPNMLRTFTVLPSLMYFIALMFQSFLELKPNIRYKVVMVVLILFFISSLYELRTYFAFQARVTRNSFELLCTLEEMKKYTRKTMPLNCLQRKNEF